MMQQKPLTLHLDFRSGLPIYIQIMNQIENQVLGGTLKPGDQLPTVRALASELRVNFNTVARAYRMLDEARIISTQQGRGTYITEIPPPEVTERLRKETLEAPEEIMLDQNKLAEGFNYYAIGGRAVHHAITRIENLRMDTETGGIAIALFPSYNETPVG